MDVEAAIQNALEKRTDIVAARKSLERDDYAMQFARNQLLPAARTCSPTYGGSASAARG